MSISVSPPKPRPSASNRFCDPPDAGRGARPFRSAHVTDRIALALAILLVAAFGVDHFAFHSAALIVIGRKLTTFIDFLQFWR